MKTEINPEDMICKVQGPAFYKGDSSEEAVEVLRMKEDCDRTIHEAIAQIDALLLKVDSILSRDCEQYVVGGGKDLTLDELEVLMCGTKKLEP